MLSSVSHESMNRYDRTISSLFIKRKIFTVNLKLVIKQKQKQNVISNLTKLLNVVK
jgi:hypothetical protein